MGFGVIFKNFGHAIAMVSKYTVVGVEDIIKFANKSQVVAPEVELLVGALAGPAASKIADLAFHALGDLANALEPLPADVTAATAANGVNVVLDLQTINDIKAIIPVIKSIINSVGGSMPPATGAVKK